MRSVSSEGKGGDDGTEKQECCLKKREESGEKKQKRGLTLLIGVSLMKKSINFSGFAFMDESFS